MTESASEPSPVGGPEPHRNVKIIGELLSVLGNLGLDVLHLPITALEALIAKAGGEKLGGKHDGQESDKS